MATSTGDSVMTTLRDLLEARSGLAGVAVEDFPYNLDELGDEWIVFIGISETQTWGAKGNLRKDEDYKINGSLRVMAPGGDRETARRMRRRAYAVYAEIENQLRKDPTVDGTCRRASAEKYDLTQWGDVEGRGVDMDFVIGVEATLPRT